MLVYVCAFHHDCEGDTVSLVFNDRQKAYDWLKARNLELLHVGFYYVSIWDTRTGEMEGWLEIPLEENRA